MTIRARHIKTAGKRRKRFARTHGTPAFPVHPEGYDPNAPDALRSPPPVGPAVSKAEPEKKD